MAAAVVHEAVEASYADDVLRRGMRDLAAPPLQVGAYRLIERIGQGGMGEVYVGEDVGDLKITVAVKIIRRDLESTSAIRRFVLERETLAGMDHPHIARVITGGRTDDGRLYVVMEYVPGKPITTFCDDEQLTIRQRLELFLQVCGAIDHAHKKAVIHRDIKPSNVLAYRDRDGKLCAKVIDFGIAKVLEQEQALTRHDQTVEGIPIGTPAYMSPEQTNGKAETRSDIYSLGALLYELLAGEAPLRRRLKAATTRDEEYRVIQREDPSTASSLVRALASPEIAQARRQPDLIALAKLLKCELQWIPLKALKKDPEERYQSAASLARDVQRYLSGEALMAGPDSRWYRARKFVSKHRGATVASTTIILLLVAGLAGTSYGLYRAERMAREKLTAEKERDENRKENSEIKKKLIGVGLRPDDPSSQLELTEETRRAWADAIQEHGENDPDTIAAMCNYALALSKVGRASDAAKLARDAVHRAREHLGFAHLQTKSAMTDLVRILESQGNAEEASQVRSDYERETSKLSDFGMLSARMVVPTTHSSVERNPTTKTSRPQPPATQPATTRPVEGHAMLPTTRPVP